MVDWMWSHPWICLVILLFLFSVIFKLTRNDQIITANGGQEADSPDEIVFKKVSIFTQDGKLIETDIVDEDYLSYDESNLEWTTKDGKEVIFMMKKGFLVKIEEL